MLSLGECVVLGGEQGRHRQFGARWLALGDQPGLPFDLLVEVVGETVSPLAVFVDVLHLRGLLVFLPQKRELGLFRDGGLAIIREVTVLTSLAWKLSWHLLTVFCIWLSLCSWIFL